MMVPVAILLFWCLSLGDATANEYEHGRRVMRTLYREFSSFVPPGHDMAVLYLEPPRSIVDDNKIRLVAPYRTYVYHKFDWVLENDRHDYSWVVWPTDRSRLTPISNITGRPNFAVAREDWEGVISTWEDKRRYKNAYRQPEFLLLTYFIHEMLYSYHRVFSEWPKYVYLLSYNFPAHSCSELIKNVATSLVSEYHYDSQLILGYYRIRASDDWNGLDFAEDYNIKLINLDEPTEIPGGELRCLNTGTSLIYQHIQADYRNDRQYDAANSNPHNVDLLELERGGNRRWYHRDFSLVSKLARDCQFHNVLALKLGPTNGTVDIVWYENEFIQEEYGCMGSASLEYCRTWIGLYENAEKHDEDYLMMEKVLNVGNYDVIHTEELAVDGMEVRLFYSTGENTLTFQKSSPWQSDCGYDAAAINYNSEDPDDTEPLMMMQLEVNSGQIMTYIWIGGITPDCCTNAGTYSYTTEEYCLRDVNEILLQSGRSAAEGHLASHFPSKMWFLPEMDCEPYVSSENEWATCQCTYSTNLPSRYYKGKGDYGFRLVAMVEGATMTYTTNASPEWIPGIC